MITIELTDRAYWLVRTAIALDELLTARAARIKKHEAKIQAWHGRSRWQKFFISEMPYSLAFGNPEGWGRKMEVNLRWLASMLQSAGTAKITIDEQLYSWIKE